MTFRTDTFLCQDVETISNFSPDVPNQHFSVRTLNFVLKRTILEVSILYLFEWNFLGVDSRDLKFCMKTPWTPRKLFCLVNFEF